MDGFTARDAAEKLGAEIGAEHALIFNRLGYFVGAQSFLITALAISLNGGPDSFIWTLRILGEIMCLLAALGIFAAVWVQTELMRRQSRLLTAWRKRAIDPSERDASELYYRVACVGRGSRWLTHWAAMAAPLVIPLLFGWAWIKYLPHSANPPRPAPPAREQVSGENGKDLGDLSLQPPILPIETRRSATAPATVPATLPGTAASERGAGGPRQPGQRQRVTSCSLGEDNQPLTWPRLSLPESEILAGEGAKPTAWVAADVSLRVDNTKRERTRSALSRCKRAV